MMTMPTSPSAIAAIRGRVSRSPRNADRQDRRPDRCRELDRDQLAERDQRQRVEPGKLSDIMGDVAADMLQRAPCAHRGQAAAEIDQRQQHEEADHRAHFQDLEDVELGGRGAAGDRHRQKRGDRPGHPRRGLEVRRFSSHGRLCGRRGLWRQRFRAANSAGPAWPLRRPETACAESSADWADEVARTDRTARLTRPPAPAGWRCGPCRTCSRSPRPCGRICPAANRWRLRPAPACATARRRGPAGRPCRRR